MNRLLISSGLCAAAILAVIISGRDATSGPRSVPQPAVLLGSASGELVMKVASATPRTYSEQAAPAPEKPPAGTLDFSKVTDTEEFLSTYWGDDWEDVKAEMLAAGKPADELDISFLRPWEEVEPIVLDTLIQDYSSNLDQVRDAFIGWSKDVLSAADLPEEFGVSELSSEHVLTIRELVSPYNERLDGVARIYQDSLFFTVISSFQAGRYEKHPIVFPHYTLGTPGVRANRLVVARSIASHGWTMYFHLTRDDNPEFDAWLQDIEQLQQGRDQAVRDYLASV